MFPWNDIQQITQHIYEQTRIPTECQRLFFRGREITAYHKKPKTSSSSSSLLSSPLSGKEPEPKPRSTEKKKKKLSSPTLSFFGITHESIIYLQCNSANEEVPIVPYGYSSVLLECNESSSINKKLIDHCKDGLYDDMRPSLAGDGEGGTYFLRNNNNEKIACFKPSDEEAGCINNPRGRTDPQQAMHSGIKPSEGHLREIAAYLIDNNQSKQKFCGFHCVPPTLRVEVAYNGFHYNRSSLSSSSLQTNGKTNHLQSGQMDKLVLFDAPPPKIGALQKFIKGEVIENFGVKNFAIREVHKIGILDIRILNCDRNTGNVLVSRDEYGRYELIPIDHGLSLPEKIEITRDSWAWLDWDQSKQPFDPYTIEYINNIDIERDIQHLMSELNFPQITFENMRIAHLVLKKGANKGLTLHEIGSIIARPDFDTKSILEELMTQAEILAVEKFRQRKHLYNRIRLKRRVSVEKKQSALHQEKDAATHIVHKFLEKGRTLKPPLFNAAATRHTMCYVPSLAPPNARIENHRSNSFQVLNRRSPLINGGSPGIATPTSSNGSMKSSLTISPNPKQLSMSTSLGSGAGGLSFTPEPYVLYNASKPKALIVHKAGGLVHKTESNGSNSNGYSHDDDKQENNKVSTKLSCKSGSNAFEMFWTPTYRAQTSSMSQQSSSTGSVQRKSLTPDRRETKKSPQMLPDFVLETPPANYAAIMPIKSRISVDRSEPMIDALDADAMKDELSAPRNGRYPAIRSMEKTSSIHDRSGDGSSMLEQTEPTNTTAMNPIFKSISAATNDTGESDSMYPDEDAATVNMEIFGRNICTKAELDGACDGQDNKKHAKLSLSLTIDEMDDNYNAQKNGKSSMPFSAVNFGSSGFYTTPNKAAQPRNGSGEMVPLSRSASCIDVPKAKTSTISLQSLDSTRNTNQSSNPLLQASGLSKDEDAIFLYGSNATEIKSASLIDHPSMLEKRKEMLALNSDDSNGSQHDNHRLVDVASHSFSQISMAPPSALALTPFALDVNSNSNHHEHSLNAVNNLCVNGVDSPSNSNVVPAAYSNHNSVHTPSAKSQSQDDNIVKHKDHEFGIHPIMQRMAKESQEVRKWFMYYLDQLLGIQCERISNRSRKTDDRDDIYDLDTVNGSFLWKNELRKQWIRSRVEYKKMLRAEKKPPRNPFEDHIEFISHEKPKMPVPPKTAPIRPVSQNPWQHDVDESDSSDEDEDALKQQPQNTGRKYIDLNNLSDEDDDDDDEEEEEHDEAEEDEEVGWFAADTVVDHDEEEDESENESDEDDEEEDEEY